jgi:transcriptional regulator with XRE-family HTH domain
VLNERARNRHALSKQSADGPELARDRPGRGEPEAEALAPRREFERELLRGEWIENIEALREGARINRRQLADRLEVSEARISKLMGGGENVTVNTLADVGWALGVRFVLMPVPLDDTSDSPAAEDPEPGRWLASLRRNLSRLTRAPGPPKRA